MRINFLLAFGIILLFACFVSGSGTIAISPGENAPMEIGKNYSTSEYFHGPYSKSVFYKGSDKGYRAGQVILEAN